MSEPCIEDYTIGWICALQEEFEATCRMLDEEFDGPETGDINDNNTYVFGRIHEHNVVIGCLPDGRYGIGSAAVVSRDMVRSFPSLKFALMVGIGGGAPTPDRDIRLGDVVVSVPQGKLGGVVQYDFGKRLPDGRFQLTGQMNSPPEVLLGALPDMQRRHNDPRKPDRILEHLKLMDDMPAYKRPAEDRLYRADYQHKDGMTCASCATNGLEERPLRVIERAVTVHYGTIASANSVMKNAEERDKYARDPELKVLCFEMEAAGLMNNFPCLVIRGICDYSDSHKNDEWHKYAALVAAAYARELLHVLKPRKVTVLPSWASNMGRILADLHNEVSAASRKTDTVIHHQQTKEAKDILDWLTPVNYGPQQSDYFGRRQPGTGRWLLDTVEFCTWRDTCGQTLFCPGIPGAGKTIITSVVVDNLETLFGADRDVGIAYIYYNFRRQNEQTAKEVLASLLKQLVQTMPIFPESVKSLYDKHKDKRSRPSLEEISSTLQSTASLYSRVFFLIDALDECRAYDDSRVTFLAEIFKFPANIFATSRFIPNIMESLKDSITLEIRARDEDVRRYVHNNISRLPASIRRSSELQTEVTRVIVDSVGGMFLLAQLHLESLIGKTSVKAIRIALAKLPRGSNAYDHAYETAMERIERQVLDHRSLAKQILSWITCAKRPLTTVELRHALAVEVGTSKLDEDALPEIEDIVLVCVGLVTIDEQSGIIRLVHYTTQQYFDRNREKWFANAEADIATTCVTYMSFDVFESGFCHTNEDLEERMRLNPLYHYCAHYWGDHAREAPALGQEAIDFLEFDTKVESSSQALMAVKVEQEYSQDVPRQMTGLHLVAYFGIKDAAQILATRNIADLTDSYGRTALWYAAARGHETVVKLLLDTGKVDVNTRDTLHGQTPLWRAAAGGYEGIVKLLLNIGEVDVDAKDPIGRTPLSWAAKRGYKDIVKLLLDTGNVDVNARDTVFGWTPLSRAIERGDEGIVKLLLGTGNVDLDAKDRNGQTPLSRAAAGGHEGIVKLLLDTGKVDVDAEDEDGHTPLWGAAERGHEGIVKLLLDTGNVDVNAIGTGYGWKPLSQATKWGHEGIVKLLLDTGNVDVDAKDPMGRTPLSRAAAGGHEGIVKLLLGTGNVDVDAEDEDGQTPLSWAAAGGHEGIVKLLLGTSNLDVNARGTGYGWKPLSQATKWGHEGIVKLLLDTGNVDVDAKDPMGRTPLWDAAKSGHEGIVKLLLDRGKVDVNAKDTVFGWTPLSRAIERGDEGIFKLLLDTGKVDVDAKDRNGQTPLWDAANRGYKGIVKLLLDTGNVDVNARDTVFGWTPLSRAIERGDEGIFKLLLNTGNVDVDAEDEDGHTPLWGAAERGHEGIVKLLLDTGNVDVDAKDPMGRTPLWGAAERGHEGIVKLLLDTGNVDVDAKDPMGRTPLWGAAERGHEGIVKLLLGTGNVDVDARDTVFGWTPLSWAVAGGHEGIVKLLLKY
ncbi:hypothetical protein FOMA001_g17939 [Fusarium oxysporum f. sp. matthiolae]|nr:hypothetical protein FOMA001_g17939 [Fusarium oxysporum f. sp. matthiolae]